MKWNDGVMLAFAATMGFITGILIAAPVLESHSVRLLDGSGRLQWETLFTGAAAILAAFLTVRTIGEQIQQARDSEADARRRRERAARTALPMALIEFTDYIKSVITLLCSLRVLRVGLLGLDRELAEQILARDDFHQPRLPEAVLHVFKECTEFASDRAAEEFVLFMRTFQIQYSRASAIFWGLGAVDSGHVVVWPNIGGCIAKAGELLVRGNDLLAYARFRRLRRNPITAQDIESALNETACRDDAVEIANNWQNIYSREDQTVAAYIEARYEPDAG
jgi:hypothetical protein